MNRARYRLVALATLPFLLALAVDLILFAVLRDRLPDRLASQFNGSGGAPSDYTSRTSWVAVATGLSVGLAVVWGAIAATADFAVRGARWAIGAGYAVAGLVGYLLAVMLYVNLDAVDGSEARMPLWHLAVALGVGALAAGVGALLLRLVKLPEVVPSPGPGLVERLDLGESEVAGWARRAPSRTLCGVGLALLAAGGGLTYVYGWGRAAAPLVCGLVTLLCSCAYVTVDRHGLTARPTVLPWPRVRIPLADVDRAVSREVKALAEYGGWGYRVRPGRSGLILRSGEAIVVRRTGGREFAVTVSDSATAAALLNTLAEREAVRR
ncbi:DUF1648 domain-containing protein [Streptomyces sp. CBMA152]|uniref:DUF1648 domain-containing protein n=1 Tax=Streptomyces sp. CBMA152 TaxID=1896312 RepID=UPI00166143DD|nr:DUF1648 domain-containing protein [Streptomyces sp. CBMA152]MBD0747575.1 hypothetical protein [Streptomyces sp. CBMA152]